MCQLGRYGPLGDGVERLAVGGLIWVALSAAIWVTPAGHPVTPLLWLYWGLFAAGLLLKGRKELR